MFRKKPLGAEGTFSMLGPGWTALGFVLVLVCGSIFTVFHHQETPFLVLVWVALFAVFVFGAWRALLGKYFYLVPVHDVRPSEEFSRKGWVVGFDLGNRQYLLTDRPWHWGENISVVRFLYGGHLARLFGRRGWIEPAAILRRPAWTIRRYHRVGLSEERLGVATPGEFFSNLRVVVEDRFGNPIGWLDIGEAIDLVEKHANLLAARSWYRFLEGAVDTMATGLCAIMEPNTSRKGRRVAAEVLRRATDSSGFSEQRRKTWAGGARAFLQEILWAIKQEVRKTA